jgi:hypothetical protein
VTDIQASLEEYRGTREALEAALLPLATSVDGRRFTFQVSLHALEFEPGGYVAIEEGGSTRLGRSASALAAGTASFSTATSARSTTPWCVGPLRTR